MTSEGVTQLLERWGGGDREALGELMPLVEDELRKLARHYMRLERADHTLQPTALVNEAYLKLVGQRARWQNRKQFYGVAAQLMRRILVDHARERHAAKRGGAAVTLTLGTAERLGARAFSGAAKVAREPRGRALHRRRRDAARDHTRAAPLRDACLAAARRSNCRLAALEGPAFTGGRRRLRAHDEADASSGKDPWSYGKEPRPNGWPPRGPART